MSIALTNVTGGAQTGFTTPGYTVTADNSVDGNVKKWVVTALTGTQTGVRAHSVSDEFSFMFVKPRVMKTAPLFSTLNPAAAKVETNRYWIIIRKGGIPASGLNSVPQIIKIPIDVTAGVDSYDAPNMRAMVSMLVGALNQLSAGIGDTLANGIL